MQITIINKSCYTINIIYINIYFKGECKLRITFTGLREDELNFFKSSLEKEDCKFYSKPLEDINISEILDTEILSIFVFDKVNKEVLDKLENLKLIITRSAGVDHIDIEECRKRGIKVANLPAYSPRSIAEHSLAFILALIKNIKFIETREKNLDFSQESSIMSVDLDELKVGIIGTGKIGSELAKMCISLGMEVLAFDIYENEELKNIGVKYTSLNKLLELSDIVSLHIPYTKDTHNLIDREKINLMKDGAILINTARGKVVDTNAVYEAVKTGKISGLGLDVFEDEDILILKKYKKGFATDKNLKILELLQLPNVLITPHTAYFTKKATSRMKNCTLEIINRFKSGKSLGRFEVV